MYDNKLGEKKKYFYKEIKEMGRCIRYIYICLFLYGYLENVI